MHNIEQGAMEDAGSHQYLSNVGITAVFEIGPFAPGPEAYPALSFSAAYRPYTLWLDWEVRGKS